MPILHLGDVHVGTRKGNQIVREYIFNYLKYLITYCIDNGIDDIIQYGDFFDNQSLTKNMDLHYISDFKKELEKTNITMHVIIGNHDILEKSTLSKNNIDKLLQSTNIKIYNKPTDVTIQGIDFCMVPWICNDNEAECLDVISKSEAEYCCGHFELSGFKMYKNTVNHDGMSPDILKKFKMVLSGHFHHGHVIGNVNYIGTPYHLTWQDVGDSKGVYVQRDHDFDFIDNHSSLFKQFIYDYDNMNDSQKKDYVNIDFLSSILKNRIVKIIVKSKSARHYTKFKQLLPSAGCIEYSTLDESVLDVNNNEVEDITGDEMDMMKDYIESNDNYKNHTESLLSRMDELMDKVSNDQKQIAF